MPHDLPLNLTPCSPEVPALGDILLAILRLIMLQGPVVFFAVQLARTMFTKSNLLTWTIAAMAVYVLSVSTGAWAASLFEFNILLELFAWSWLLGVIGIMIRKYGGPGASQQQNNDTHHDALKLPTIAGIITVSLLAGWLLITGFNPRFDHDPMTYQLHFAASWLQSGGVHIVPTPFGDPSHAYGPQIASTLYMWLMASLGTDMLAMTGAWFFFMLSILAATGLARELGAKQGWAWSAALFASLAPLFLYEGRSAYSDVAVAGFFCASIYFFVRAIRSNSGVEVLFALACAGMTGGAKYTALGLMVILAPLLILAAIRVRARKGWPWWLAGILAGTLGGGIWYLRNWVLTGSPTFPIRVSLAGWAPFPGMYGKEQLSAWIFDKHGFMPWLGVVDANASIPLLVIWIAAMAWTVAHGIGLLKKIDNNDKAPEPSAGRPDSGTFFGLALVYTALIPLLIDRLNWHLYPFQVYRFWVPAVPVLSALAATALSRRQGLCIGALVLVCVGFFIRPPAGYLGFFGSIWPRFGLPACALFGTAVAGVYYLWARDRENIRPVSFKLLAFVGVFVFLATVRWSMERYDQRRFEAMAAWDYGKGWQSLPCGGNGLTIAYTGANLPYPLHGSRVFNRIVYIDTSGRVMPLDHEVWDEFKYEKPRFRTPEPIVSRLEHCPRKWARAMIESEVDVLVVMNVLRNALVNTAHDRSGWPVEDQWARQAQELFRLAYEDEFARIYLVYYPGKESLNSLDSGCIIRPVDAPTACLKASPDCERLFPRAMAAMEEMGI